MKLVGLWPRVIELDLGKLLDGMGILNWSVICTSALFLWGVVLKLRWDRADSLAIVFRINVYHDFLEDIASFLFPSMS
jgi:hypothetical protein